jgi:hypothetical protein
MLATAQGYAVFDREGTRIGAFIELAGAGGDRIAIRHEGVFVWRRRLLSITTVAKVVPDQRAVVLTVDGRALAGSETSSTSAPGTSGIAEEYAHSGGDWRDRLESYLAPVEGQADQADLSGGAEHERRQAPTKPGSPSRARRISRRRSRAEEISPPPNSTCCSSRHQAATYSSNGKVPLRLLAAPSSCLSKRFPSSSRSWAPHHSRTTAGSAPISSRPSRRPKESLCRACAASWSESSLGQFGAAVGVFQSGRSHRSRRSSSA